jgi:hypothetical protein
MGNIFTLDSLREEVEKQYAPVTITLADGSEVLLRNLLRLPRKLREEALETLRELENVEQDSADESSVDKMTEVASSVLDLVAESGGKRLIRELDGDLTLTMKVLQRWMESTQVGEAERSHG